MPSSNSKVDRLVQGVLARIQSGELQPGQKLRSLHDEATANGVAKNTVVEAYLRLVAQGVLQSRQGSGYYVARSAARPRPNAALPFAGITDGETLLTEQLERRLAVRPGDGRLPPDWLEESRLRNDLSSIRLLSSDAYNYNAAWGYLPLRERLCGGLAERGITVSPDQLLMTQGANHAMDLESGLGGTTRCPWWSPTRPVTRTSPGPAAMRPVTAGACPQPRDFGVRARCAPALKTARVMRFPT